NADTAKPDSSLGNISSETSKPFSVGSTNMFSASTANPTGSGLFGNVNSLSTPGSAEKSSLNPVKSLFGSSSNLSSSTNATQQQGFGSTSNTSTPLLTASTLNPTSSTSNLGSSFGTGNLGSGFGTTGNTGFSIAGGSSGIFGNNSSTQNSTGFGSNTNLFGAANSNSTTNSTLNTNQASNMFQSSTSNMGSQPSTTTSGGFSFGSQVQPSSTFGTLSNGNNKREIAQEEPLSKKPFAFGASSSSNISGFSTNTPSTGAGSSGGFSFGANFGAPGNNSTGSSGIGGASGSFLGSGFGANQSQQQQPTSTFSFGANSAMSSTGMSASSGSHSMFGTSGQTQGFGGASGNQPNTLGFGQTNSSVGSPATPATIGQKFNFGASTGAGSGGFTFGAGGSGGAAGGNLGASSGVGSGFSVGSVPSNLAGRKIARPRKIR
ncbi:hypothetical protein AYI70_g8574, partial [Smittium culicis]